MARLIDADALIDKMRRMPIFEKTDFDKKMLYVEKSIIDEMPTVVPDNNVGKWIPVTERMPEDNERVLVYHDDGMIRFGINKGGFADVVSTHYLQNNHRTCFSKVTHWMPLPPPPEGA